MGLPARKVEQRESRTRRPHLRVVGPKTRAPRSAAKRRVSSNDAAVRQVYRAFLIAAALAALLGAARVWLSVEAAEASIDAVRLRSEIKAARYAGDMLEIRQSALGSPSRIRAIAGAAMGMAPSEQVTYLDLSDEAPVKPVAQRRARTGFESALAKAMDLAAGEAQVLLVGDAGLASSK